jgi:uncharacterized membrane protein (UPF0127 family)
MKIQTHSKALSVMIGLLFFCGSTAIEATTLNITINTTTFDLEVANTPEKRAKGLMFRKDMPQKSGMIFTYASPRYVGIWMKNTYIPLDILWVSPKKEIVYIHENATPHSLTIMRPKHKAQYVIELNSGSVKRFDLKVGDKVSFKK